MADDLEERMFAECLVGRVRVLNRIVTGIYDRKLRPLGLRCSQMNILVVIAAKGPIAASEVCRWLSLEKSTLSRDLQRLAAREWVRSFPGPGRTQHLEITPAGVELIRGFRNLWDEAQAETRELLGDGLAAELLKLQEPAERADCSSETEDALDTSEQFETRGATRASAAARKSSNKNA